MRTPELMPRSGAQRDRPQGQLGFLTDVIMIARGGEVLWSHGPHQARNLYLYYSHDRSLNIFIGRHACRDCRPPSQAVARGGLATSHAASQRSITAAAAAWLECARRVRASLSRGPVLDLAASREACPGGTSRMRELKLAAGVRAS